MRSNEIHVAALTFEGRGIFAPAAAKTGYVVLRIEPGGQGRQSRPWRASSAFPTLTGPYALAAGLRGPDGPVEAFYAFLGVRLPADDLGTSRG